MAEFIQHLLGEHFESVIHVKVSKKTVSSRQRLRAGRLRQPEGA